MTFAYSILGAAQPDINGASPLCSSSTYTAVNLPANVYVSSWQVQQSGSVVQYTPNGTYISVTPLSSGSFTLIANLSASVCGNTSITKTFNAGAPYAPISSTPGACNGSTQTWTLSANSAYGSNWHWTVGSGNIYIYNPYSSTTFADVTGGGAVNVTYTDQCGVSKSDGVTIYASCPHFAITASPNPTTNNVTIAVTEQKGVAIANQKKTMLYQIKVVDQFSTVKKQYKFSAGTSNTNISLSGLISGIYTIQAFDGTTWSSVKVIKQ